MKINRQVVIAVVSIGAVMAGTTLVFGQGCSQTMKQATVASNSSSFSAQCSGKADVIDKNFAVLPNQITVSVAYGQQLLDNYVSCTGIGQPSARTMDEWVRRNQSLSEYGHLTDVSGAMMMAASAVAGEVCRDLVNKEKPLGSAERSFFISSNLASNTGLSSSQISEAVNMFALACWQRAPETEEISAISDAIGGLNASSDAEALSLCTAMLSSLSGISQ